MYADGFYLRPATPEDAADLSAFAVRLFRETFGKDNTAEDMEAYIRSAFSTELQAQEIVEPDALVLLALVPSEGSSNDRSILAAYAHLTRTSPPSPISGVDAFELRRFYVAKEWQGRGLANELMLEIMHHARIRGARTLWLGVWERNPRAIAFYRKHGFREVGSHAFLLGSDRQTDLLMAVSLDDAAGLTSAYV